MLELFNESEEMDGPLQQSLDMVTSALDGRVGEIWLVNGENREVELRYSSSARSPEANAFAAAGRGFVADTGPELVARVLKSGRVASIGASVERSARDRASVAAGLGIRGAIAFPLRTTGNGVIAVLAVYRPTVDRPSKQVHDAVAVACHHIARFLERVSAEGAVHAAARELSALASTDALTGLKNRREFDRALRTVPREPFAILSLDVDRLKEINDTHGHAAGDAMLRTVGTTLGLIVRGWDVMARVGGDEFAALLPGVGVFGATLVAERMRTAMHSLTVPGGTVRITVGWSAAPAGADPVSVWQRADESLYNAKHAGGDRVEGSSYERGEAGDIADRSYSDVVMRILEGGPLDTLFQPIINLFDGSVIGYEALARPEGFAAMDFGRGGLRGRAHGWPDP